MKRRFFRFFNFLNLEKEVRSDEPYVAIIFVASLIVGIVASLIDFAPSPRLCVACA